jgi:hypothetical protein
MRACGAFLSWDCDGFCIESLADKALAAIFSRAQ